MFPPLTLAAMPESPRYYQRNNNNNNSAAAGKSSHHLVGQDYHPHSPSSQEKDREATRIKLVFIGDGSVGKTSLLVSYTTNGYPTEYIPTAFDKYSVSVDVDNQPLRVQLFDTAGQDDFDSLRPLCYPDTDIFLICFSVVSPTSFRNIKSKWLPEIQRYTNPSRSSQHKIPILLVGTQADLRHDVSCLVDLARYNERPISDADARELMRNIGARDYIECSALTQWNLKNVFDTAIVAALSKDNSPVEPEPMVTCNDLLKRTASRTKKEGKRILPTRRSWKKYCCIF